MSPLLYYLTQCCTPAAKRQYDYFPLPILHNGELIGRLDAKAHRKEGIFEVRSWYLEDGMQNTVDLAGSILKVVQSCADWHHTPQVKMREEPDKI